MYFSFTKYEKHYLGVWQLKGNKAARVGIPDAWSQPRTHFVVRNDETLEQAFKRQFPECWHPEAILVEMKLPSGGFYPRISRPSAAEKLEVPGYLPLHSQHQNAVADACIQMGVMTERMKSSLRVVHPSVDNFNSYGLEFREILISAATEFESQCKAIQKANNYRFPKRPSIKDYCKLNKAMKLSEYAVQFNSYPKIGKITPFSDWRVDTNNPLGWYQSYNLTKHDRENELQEATLKNAITALAACYVILFAQYGFSIQNQFNYESNLQIELSETPVWTIDEAYFIDLYSEPQSKRHEIDFIF